MDNLHVLPEQLITMSTGVSIKNLSYAYQQNLFILQNIHLNIRPGQVVAVMGGSGSGKSTLLKLISGQLTNYQGSIQVLGQDLRGISQRKLYAIRKQTGMLFQNGALFTDLNVFDNIAFPLREHTALDENIIRNLVYMKLYAVGLFGTQSLMPSQLSGGMAKRVALARAMALDPQLLLYDEPFSGLDPLSLRHIGSLIRKLNNALGACSLMTTHAIAESLALVDYVYFIHQGQIRAAGTPQQIREHADPVVQEFMFGTTGTSDQQHFTAIRDVADLPYLEALR